MPVERHPISHGQLCELLGVDPKRFIDLEPAPRLRESERKGQPVTGWVMVLEPEETVMTQTRGTNPPLYGGKGTKKGGGKKKC